MNKYCVGYFLILIQKTYYRLYKKQLKKQYDEKFINFYNSYSRNNS